MVRATDLVFFLHQLDEALRHRTIVLAVERGREGQSDRCIAGQFRHRCVGGGRSGHAANLRRNANLDRLLRDARDRIDLTADGEHINAERLYLEKVGPEIEVRFLHLGFVGRIDIVGLLHEGHVVLREADRGTIVRIQIGDLLADVLGQILGVHRSVESLRHRRPEDPGAAFLGDVGVGRVRNDLWHFLLCRDVDHRQRNRAAGRAQYQMHLALVDEAIDVGDALVGLAFVVEQNHLDLLAVDAARGVDALQFVLRHLAVLDAVLDDHAQRHADADDAVLGMRGVRDTSERQCGCRRQRQNRFLHADCHF